jgi:hypothetical protein
MTRADVRHFWIQTILSVATMGVLVFAALEIAHLPLAPPPAAAAPAPPIDRTTAYISATTSFSARAS